MKPKFATKPKKRPSPDELFDQLPRAEKVVALRLRRLVKECLPKAYEKISYGAPFYGHHRMICFIWPPSVGWGPKQEWNDKAAKGTVLGFCQGFRMSNEGGVLKAEGRQRVYCMYFSSPQDIDEPLVRALLFEAGMIDDLRLPISRIQGSF